jgi:hypothetical protein
LPKQKHAESAEHTGQYNRGGMIQQTQPIDHYLVRHERHLERHQHRHQIEEEQSIPAGKM